METISMKIYKGFFQRGLLWITVFAGNTTYELKHIERHSPDGFNWGYGGSGPGDTALSILTDCIGAEKAESLYHQFKHDIVAAWPKPDGLCWEITEEQIQLWADIQLGKPIGVPEGK